MGQNALQRLFEDAISSETEKSQYSMEEQLDLDDDDDFLDVMGPDSKNALLEHVQDLTKVEPLEEPEPELKQEEVKVEPEPEVQEVKRGRGRPRKTEEAPQPSIQKVEEPKVSNLSFNGFEYFMTSLSIDLITELRKTNYVTRNFSKEQMETILNFIESKLKED